MLVQLSIHNFALIAHTELQFPDGFISITGETGSGKSIFLGALNLILGERADYSVIRDAEKKTSVEAVFKIKPTLQSWFVENDIDWEEETVVRREITSQGKSRAFINDTPVQLNVLKSLTEQLVYIHSQHQTLELKNGQFQLNLIDTFSGNLPALQIYKTDFLAYKKVISRQEKLKQELAHFQQERDFIQFQLSELDTLDLSNNNYEGYDDELKRMDQLDDLRIAFSALSTGISTESGPLDNLRLIKQTVEKWKSRDTQLAGFSERLTAVIIELDDLVNESSDQLESLEMDPQRQQFLIGMLDKYNHVMRKYQFSSQDQLVGLCDELRGSADNADVLEATIASLSIEIETLYASLQNQANQLHESRLKGAEALVKHLKSVLVDLKLQNTEMAFEWMKQTDLDINAGYAVQLLFTANAGMPPKPIERTASGGELSRLMLAVQATLSQQKALPTLLLDEIDTGVSGDVAMRIGRLLNDMGQHMQLLAITHLPQVAAKGQAQFEVVKHSDGNVTNTTINLLTQAQRTEAIAKLMSGEQVTQESRASAEQLMLS